MSTGEIRRVAEELAIKIAEECIGFTGLDTDCISEAVIGFLRDAGPDAASRALTSAIQAAVLPRLPSMARMPAELAIEKVIVEVVDRIRTGGGGDDSGGPSNYNTFGFSLSVGTGAGWVTTFATPVERGAFDAVVEQPGVSSTPFHSLAELDIWVSSSFAISAFARIQIVEFADLYGGRIKYVFSRGQSSFRLRLGGGYGWVRHLIQLGEVYDTTLEGPGMVTLGLSWVRKINKSTNFVISPDYLQLFGAAPFGPSYHVDLSMGVEFGF
jgi:hypothetical protein